MTSSQGRPLTREEVAAFGAELDELRSRIVADLGENDARYVRRIRDAVRWSALGGRALSFRGTLQTPWGRGPARSRARACASRREVGRTAAEGAEAGAAEGAAPAAQGLRDLPAAGRPVLRAGDGR